MAPDVIQLALNLVELIHFGFHVASRPIGEDLDSWLSYVPVQQKRALGYDEVGKSDLTDGESCADGPIEVLLGGINRRGNNVVDKAALAVVRAEPELEITPQVEQVPLASH